MILGGFCPRGFSQETELDVLQDIRADLVNLQMEVVAIRAEQSHNLEEIYLLIIITAVLFFVWRAFWEALP